MTNIESSATILSFILSLIDQIRAILLINNGGQEGLVSSHRRAINSRSTNCSSFFIHKIFYSSYPPISASVSLFTTSRNST